MAGAFFSSSSRPAAPRRLPVVLVVDDDPDLRELVSVKLGLAGYEVLTAADGRAALAAASGRPIDLILLDVRLPGPSGVEICRRLRSDPYTRDVPVVLLTEAGDDSLAEAEAFGVTAALTKPFGVRELVDAVDDLLAGVAR